MPNDSRGVSFKVSPRGGWVCAERHWPEHKSHVDARYADLCLTLVFLINIRDHLILVTYYLNFNAEVRNDDICPNCGNPICAGGCRGRQTDVNDPISDNGPDQILRSFTKRFSNYRLTENIKRG